ETDVGTNVGEGISGPQERTHEILLVSFKKVPNNELGQLFPRVEQETFSAREEERHRSRERRRLLPRVSQAMRPHGRQLFEARIHQSPVSNQPRELLRSTADGGVRRDHRHGASAFQSNRKSKSMKPCQWPGTTVGRRGTTFSDGNACQRSD